MNSFLAIETTSDVCSVALITRGRILSRETDEKRAHARLLVPMIQELLEEAGEELAGVAVSGGPGSYTGLRIGVSTAKGLAWSRSLPFFAVSTLASQVSRFNLDHSKDSARGVLSLIRARGSEVFSKRFEIDGDGKVHESPANANSKAGAVQVLDNLEVSGSDFVVSHDESLIQELREMFPGIQTALTPLVAESMAPLLLNQEDEYRVNDLSSFEPFYLREFTAKKSAKSVFDRLPF